MDATAYRQFAELEDSHFWFLARRRIFFHLLDRLLERRQGLRILEIGCGSGGMLRTLARYGEVTGLDISMDVLRFARSRGAERLCVASGHALPVQPHALDLIALFDAIEHIPDDVQVLQECRRALKPGGLVFLSVPAYQFLYANNDRVAHHLRRYTRRQLRQRLSAAGLAPVKVTYFNTLLFPLILPTVLMKKLQESFRPVGDRTNLSHHVPAALNRLLADVIGSERHLLSGIDFPFGHSIIAVGRA